jgi:hypothetical protein
LSRCGTRPATGRDRKVRGICYWNCALSSATTSDDGLRLCAELRPGAVFVDINLPDKDGVSLAPVFLSKWRPADPQIESARERRLSHRS